MSSLDYLKKYTTVVADTGNFEGKYDFVVMETCLPVYLVSMSKILTSIMKAPTEYLWIYHFVFRPFSGRAILFHFNLSCVIVRNVIGAPDRKLYPSALISVKSNLKAEPKLSVASAESGQSLQIGNSFYLCCKLETLTEKSSCFKMLNGTIVFYLHQQKVIFSL